MKIHAALPQVSSLAAPAPSAVPAPADRFSQGGAPAAEGLSRSQIAELMRKSTDELVEWTARIPEGTQAPPSLGPDGTLYVATESGVSALLPDGTSRWNWKGNANSSVTPRILPEGRVLIPGGYKNDGLVCLDAQGNQLWKSELPASQEEAAPIPGGGLYYGDYSGTLHRLEDDGKPAWTWSTPEGRYGMSHINGGPEVLPDGSAVVIADPGALYAVNPDGSLKWAAFDQEDGARASTCRQPLATAEGDLLVTGGSNSLLSLDPQTGEVRWEYLAALGKREDQLTPEEREDYVAWGNTLLSGSPRLSPDGATIYVGGQGGRITALDRQGNRRWELDLDENGYHEPCTVGGDGTVYFVSMEGSVHAVSPEGKPLWAFRPTDSSQYSFVTARGDTVYLTTSSGRVHALSQGALARRLEKAEAEGKTPVLEITDAEVIIGGVKLPRREG